ncbi:MAG: PAS domain S-box protein [Williamsia sp.]|nr:PAS domain S-box protein [Williamsia sp.]
MDNQEPENTDKAIEQLQEKPGKDEFLIVGIGASEGGIQALQEFFSHVPANSGMAYVVILHLSPDYDSQLVAILQKEMGIPVTQVTDRVTILPNHVYVVPPNQHLTIERESIAVSANLSTEERRAPVDLFLRTLADQHGPRTVAVILSGTGANGSMGLKRVKERGGVGIVQNPREAQFSEMPRNSIATEMVDEVLPVAEIPAKIIAYKDSLGTVEIVEDAEKRPEEQQHALREIFTLLRVRTGHDFSNYKRPTLLRRIERRVNIHNLPDLPAYARFLQEHTEETGALLKDLLISVTNFFRDKKAFEMVEQELLPLIFQAKTNADKVRIWVAGCATGEEAYSIAMLCAERTMSTIDAPKVQIFATDIDESAVAHAREGLYTLNDTADVSAERLRRFFNKEGEHFRIRREIRETILFAQHNFLKDSPFSHLDMVTCRNVLIYLNGVAQEKVIETFHFALKPGGYLFLGSSESVDGASDLYSAYSRENHIFQSRHISRHIYSLPQLLLPPLYSGAAKRDSSSRDQENKTQERTSFGDLHHQMLEEYAPPSLIVNEEYEIVHLSERAGNYLQVGGGEPSQNLLKLIKPELRLELRSALYQAVQRQSAVEAKGVHVKIDNKIQTVNIHVRPVLRDGDQAKGFILIVFEPAAETSSQGVVLSSAEEPMARQLEEQLVRAKAQLRAANEQHDFQAEEMKAANEELLSANEELRSTTEELETSKEELQSINEELHTVNQELKVKVEETSHVSNNLQNLIYSTDIGTIFLDRIFRIVLYTPAAGSIFNLIPADISRPLSDITHRLEYADILSDAETVLEKLNIIEREVRTREGKIYLLRLTPYRTDEDRIKGVVITFVDISERKQAEEALRTAEENHRIQLEQEVEQRTKELKESRDQYLSLVENTSDVITRWNRELKLVFANAAFEGKTGSSNQSQLGKTNREMGQPDEIAIPYMNSLQRTFETGETVEHVNSFPTPAGEVYFYSRLTPEKNAAGEVETVLAIARDITDIKKADLELLDLKDRLAQKATDKFYVLFNSIDEAFVLCEMITDEQGKPVDYRMLELNPAFEKMTGITVEQAKGRTAREVVPTIEDWWIETYATVALKRESVRFENRVEELDRWFNFYASPFGEEQSRQFVIVYADITARKQAEQRQAFLLKLSDGLRSLDDPIGIQAFSADLLGEHLKVNQAHYDEVIGEYVYISYSYGNGVPPLTGKFPHHDFGERLVEGYRAGKTQVSYNTATDPPISETVRGVLASAQMGAYIAVPLVKNREWVATLAVHNTIPRQWKQNEIDLVEEVAERTWAAVERARAEEALAMSEEKFRTLFNSMEEGVVTLELIFNEAEEVVDFIYVDHNPALLRQTGLSSAIVGQRVGQLFPDLEKHWFEAYGRVAKTGTPERNEYFIVALNSWFNIYISRVGGKGSHRVIAVYNNITGRKIAEMRQAFLARLDDSLRLIANPVEIQGVVALEVMNHFQVERCYYCEIAQDKAIIRRDAYREGLSSIANTYSLQDLPLFNTVLKTAQPIVVEDVHVSEEMDDHLKQLCISAGIVSYINIPVIKEQQQVGRFCLTQSTPRKWTKTEIDLASETAERTWAAIERANTEEALRTSEERLRITMDSAVDYAIININTEGIIQGWSSGAERMFGYTKEEAIGQSDEMIFTPEDRRDNAPQKERAMAYTEGRAPDERWHIRKDGSRFYTSGVLTPVYDGKLSGYVKVARDMTEQKQAEELLKVLEERNRVALQSAEMASWDWNIKEDRVVWNWQHHTLLGLEPNGDEKNGAYFLQIIYPGDKERVKKALEEAIAISGVYKAEFRIIRADDHEMRWMSGFGHAIEWDETRATRMVGVMFDITERKKLEQQKEDFLSIASHELKTPVTSVKAYGELLQATFEENNDKQSASLIQKMNAQVNRLNNLISDLLDTSKLTEGQLALEYEQFNLSDLIRELVEELQQLSRKHRLVIACEQTISVQADKKRMEQVISNLISNAIKYSPEGGDVTIVCEAGEKEIKVSVIDQGIGIPTDLQKGIFTRFFRVKHARSNTLPGMGLGLYITAGIIQRHGGTIGLSSHPDKGSVFYFTLPYNKPS